MSNETYQNERMAKAKKVLLGNYRQQPINLIRGEGMHLYDATGRRFLDMTAGIAVCSLGHAHPELRDAISKQANLLLHTSNLYYNDQQIEAAAQITSRCFADRVYFCNSGAEANEAALKCARRYQHIVQKKENRNKIISTHKSFHGRTMATVSITGQEKYRKGFGPLLSDIEFVDYGDIDSARKALEKEDACCIIVEPIQAEGGIVVPPKGYLKGLRELCDKTGTVLIFDEVQTGIGRTGQWFAHQWEDVVPDIMTLAKALGGGVPIGAIACTDESAKGLKFFEGHAVAHASTFGGNPLACAAAVAVLETIECQGLLQNCLMASEYLRRKLNALVDRHKEICLEVRGRGLLLGIALNQPAGPVMHTCRELGVLFSVAGGTVLRFAPPLIIKQNHIDHAVEVVDQVLSDMVH